MCPEAVLWEDPYSLRLSQPPQWTSQPGLFLITSPNPREVGKMRGWHLGIRDYWHKADFSFRIPHSFLRNVQGKWVNGNQITYYRSVRLKQLCVCVYSQVYALCNYTHPPAWKAKCIREHSFKWRKKSVALIVTLLPPVYVGGIHEWKFWLYWIFSFFNNVRKPSFSISVVLFFLM